MKRPSQKGFSLIEAILAMTIIGIGVMGVITMYHRTVDRSNEADQTLIATYLAQEKIEQIIHDKKYQGYDTIIQGNYAASENMTLQGFPGYTRTTTIQEVSPVDLTTSPPPAQYRPSGYTRITIGVSVTGGPTISFTTLVTDWGVGT